MRPNLDMESESRPFGDADRDRAFEIVLDLDVRAGGLDVPIGRLLGDSPGVSLRVGDLVFRTLRAGVNDGSSECCRGSPSAEEVMESRKFGRWEDGGRVIALAVRCGGE